jgi:hypothetical protein
MPAIACHRSQFPHPIAVIADSAVVLDGRNGLPARRLLYIRDAAAIGVDIDLDLAAVRIERLDLVELAREHRR